MFNGMGEECGGTVKKTLAIISGCGVLPRLQIVEESVYLLLGIA